MIWDTVLYHPTWHCIDVPKIGRYVIKKASRRRYYEIWLNSRKTAYTADSLEQAKAMVESIIKGTEL